MSMWSKIRLVFIRSYVACDAKETFFDFNKAFDDKILLMLMPQLKCSIKCVIQRIKKLLKKSNF